jgi:CP family cyanate transporter-like MFS transporter
VTSTTHTGLRLSFVLPAVVLVAVNLRSGIAAVSPLLPDIRADLGLSRGAAGLLTTVPVLCFGGLSAVAAGVGRRIGSDLATVLAMAVLAAATALRLLPTATWFFVGTVVLGAAITVGNVLTPMLVKQHLADRSDYVVGMATGLYTGALIGGAAVASAISAPLASAGLGWRGALLVWAIPAVLAAFAWSRFLRYRSLAPLPASGGRRVVVGSRVTWWLSLFMGMQSLAYFAVLAWLPAFLQDHDVSAGQAGLALSLFNLLGVVAALLVPTIAGRQSDQRALALSICAGWAVGVIGLLVAPGGYLAWSVIAGLAQGASIALALALIVLRARTPDVARSLSGTVQSAGYLIGATGPFLFGALRDATGSWTVPLLALLGAIVAMAAGAWGAGQARVVG